MAYYQKNLTRPANQRFNHRDTDNKYQGYFFPSRYDTMDVDTDIMTTTSTTAVSTAMATTGSTTTCATNGDTYSNGVTLMNNSNSIPSFADYPNRKPFINSEYTREPSKPVNAYPTSDRDAVLSALRNLQDKVKKLELERMAAEHNLEALASHTEQYKELVNADRYSTKITDKQPAKNTSTASSHLPSWSATSGNRQYSSLNNGRAYVNSQAKELDGQLTSAENRCQLLEKQLDYMKKLVDDSERDRRQLVEKTLKAKQDPDIRLHLDRLNDLERDQLRLNATQSLAEAKIRELEDRVGEEKLYRKNLQGKTAELESACREKKTFPTKSISTSPPPTPVIVKPAVPISKTKKPPKKKKKRIQPQTQVSNHSKSESTRHYRLNLAEIPFVAGKSTTPSHALGANVQKVLSLMKSHNSALCSHVNHQTGIDGHHQHHRSASPASTGSGSGSSVTSSSIDHNHDLTDLLNQLQEEFRQLSSDHQDLVQQLNGATDKGERLDLEQEIEVIVSRMESKAQQITKIRQHQNKYEEKKQAGSKSLKSKRPHSAGGRLTSTNNHHHHHNNLHSNLNRGTPRSQSGKPTGNSAMGKPALFMLRDMKKLQTTLRRDDLCWK